MNGSCLICGNLGEFVVWEGSVGACSQCRERAMHPEAIVPELKGALPVVLYFGTEADREEFIQLVRDAKPGMVARKL